MRVLALGVAIVLPSLTAGCGDATPARDVVAVATPTEPTGIAPAPATPADTAVTDGWVGKWVGVEGLALTIARGDRPATYRLHIALMDGASDHIGTGKGEAIRFERNGQVEVIRHTDGVGTGLKWLAGRTDCLVITPGEGFCRD